MSVEDGLQDAVEAAVRAVPAVLALYTTGLAGRLVTVSEDAVLVSIGVSASAPAPATAAAVASAVRLVLPSTPQRHVSVRVSRVTDQ